MQEQPFGCAGMHGGPGMQPDATLCPGLQRLKDEHGPLSEAMKNIRETAEQVSNGSDEDVGERFARLHRLVEQFAAELKKHSAKEDDGLFPMMARYIGRESGPIAVMEFEHEQAEQWLQRFLQEAGDDRESMETGTLKQRAGYALQAVDVLVQHFGKEENVLFPMAENMLSADEKEQLARLTQG